MRLVTGTLFGLGSAWLSLPYLDESFTDARLAIEERFVRARIAVG